MSNQPNISWPGWEVVRTIGHGSFGAVYEIQRTLFGDVEKAALKVISIPQNDSDIEELYNDGYDDESITATFHSHLKSIIAEYSLMRKMNGSSHIVNCDDVIYVPRENGFGWDIYIKMELLTPLSRALTDPIPEETVLQVAHDLCQALVLCKKHDIIHRDIKPQNIFVSPNGDYKLGDFGIAKTVEKTTGGTKIGTYKYMAPEVYHNRPYGSGADIYSLGLVLYQLLNERRLPFMPLPPEMPCAGHAEAARERRLAGEPIPAPARGSKELQQIVLKACAYDPKERFASAEEMLRALEGVIWGKTALPMTREESISTSPVLQISMQLDGCSVDNNGFSSADEMLEALGVDSPYKKKAPVEPMPTVRIRFVADNQVMQDKKYAIGEKIVAPVPPETTSGGGKLWSFAFWEPSVPETATESREFRAIYVEKKVSRVSESTVRIRFVADNQAIQDKNYTIGERIVAPDPPEITVGGGKLWSFAFWEPPVPDTATVSGEFKAIYKELRT